MTWRSCKSLPFDKLLPRFHLFILRSLVRLFNDHRVCGFIHLNYFLIQVISSFIGPQSQTDKFNIAISLVTRGLNSLLILLVNREKKQIKRLVCGIINRHDCTLYDYDSSLNESYAATFFLSVIIYFILFLHQSTNRNVFNLITIYGEFSVTICHLFYLLLVISLHSCKRQTFCLAKSDKYNLSQIDATANHLGKMSDILNNIFARINLIMSLQVVLKVTYCVLNHENYNLIPVALCVMVSILTFSLQFTVRKNDVYLANQFVVSFSPSHEVSEKTITSVRDVLKSQVSITGLNESKNMLIALASLPPFWWLVFLCIVSVAVMLAFLVLNGIARSDFSHLRSDIFTNLTSQSHPPFDYY